jgi:hypothetical protein
MTAIWKSVALSLNLATAILGFSDGASADWQGTVWGMTFDEADKSFRVPHGRGGQYGEVLVFNYATGNIAFENGVLHFNYRDWLDQISMSLVNSEECDKLFDTYRSVYGNPVSDKKYDPDYPNVPDAYVRTAIWHDPSHNNRIMLTTKDGCWVYYSPLPNPRPAKLIPAPGGL